MTKKINNYNDFCNALNDLAREFSVANAKMQQEDEFSLVSTMDGWANFSINEFLEAISDFILDTKETNEEDVDIPGRFSYSENINWQEFYNIILSGKFYS